MLIDLLHSHPHLLLLRCSLWLCSLNASLCPALSSAVVCCEGTSGKRWNQDMVSTQYLPTMGRKMRLNSRTWGGGSSMGLDQKHQPDVTSCEVSSGCFLLAISGHDLWITSVSWLIVILSKTSGLVAFLKKPGWFLWICITWVQSIFFFL